jgi:hypothetical protein
MLMLFMLMLKPGIVCQLLPRWNSRWEVSVEFDSYYARTSTASRLVASGQLEAAAGATCGLKGQIPGRSIPASGYSDGQWGLG